MKEKTTEGIGTGDPNLSLGSTGEMIGEEKKEIDLELKLTNLVGRGQWKGGEGLVVGLTPVKKEGEKDKEVKSKKYKGVFQLPQ